MKLLIISYLFSSILYSNSIRIGIDIIEDQQFLGLKDKRVALVVNHTSINSRNKHIVDIFYQNGINVKKIFSPEHGLKGNYGAGVENINDSIDYNIEVISLYGKKTKPSAADLKDIDLIVFDIQDIGIRFYTYISTMTLVMEAAIESNVDFLILDRPNPNSILGVSGPILSKKFKSYVGMHQIPIVYDLTIGELSMLLIGENWIKNASNIDIDIIKVEGWKRGEQFKLMIPPSPNISNNQTALIYPGMCFLEGTNISEGRGTEYPFMIFGAPWMKSDSIFSALKSDKFIKGLNFHEIKFTPTPSKNSKYPKYSNIECNGIQITIQNINVFKPLEFAVRLLTYIKKYNDEEFEFLSSNYIDNLYGSDELRNTINSSTNIELLIKSWKEDNDKFNKLVSKYRMY